MIKKLLILKLMLALVLQPVALVFAGNTSLEDRVADITFSNTEMNCEHMNSPDCPGMEICSNGGQAGCDVKNLRILSVVETVSLDLSHSIQPYINAHFPLTITTPLLRPPRVS